MGEDAHALREKLGPDVAHPPADAVRTPVGNDPNSVLLSKVLRAGTGATHPGANDIVVAHYTAWSADGSTIDDSRSRGKPATWIPAALMPGLAAGLQLMVAGETRRLWMPAALAHEWTAGPLVFDVEVLSVAPGRERPTPQEVSAPPADRPRTSSGMAFQVLRPGSGQEHPKPTATVTMLYTAWTSNGLEICDDSVARGAPATVAIDALEAGLAEAVQRMVVGEKTRFWIPPALANTPGLNHSALVVDMELVSIQRAGDGRPGTIRVHSNSPDARYDLVFPDGTARSGQGSQTFGDAVPGPYRIKPATIPLYTIGTVASPSDMTLVPGGSLEITIAYVPIVR